MLANAGIPMIFVEWPLMLGALVPVIIAEALLIRRWLSLSPREAFTGVTKANLISTAVGVPLAWLVMLMIEFAVLMPVGLAADHWQWKLDAPIWQALGFLFSIAWLGPYQHGLHWMVPTAAALLLIPCFYTSVWLERLTCVRAWPKADVTRVKRCVYLANLASYLVLFSLACGLIAFNIFIKGLRVAPR